MNNPDTSNMSQFEHAINFEMEPLWVITHLNETKNALEKTVSLQIRILIDDDSFDVELDGNDLKDAKSFKEKLCKLSTKIHISLKNEELKLLKNELHKEAKHKIIFSHIGYQPKSNYFLWNNAKYDFSSNTISVLEKFDNSKGYDCSENAHIEPSCPHVATLYSTKNALEVTKNFFKHFVNTFNDPVVLTCVGAVLGIAHYDKFTEFAQGYPSIYLLGESQTGKSTIQNCLASIFGIHNISKQASGTSTLFALRSELEMLYNIPLFIEELNIQDMKNFCGFVKNHFSALTRKRGSKDGSIQSMTINTALCSNSNDLINDFRPETLSRILFTQLKKEQFNLANFEYFSREKRIELSAILPLILFYRERIPALYKQNYEKLTTMFTNSDRNLNNLAISMTMWQIINDIVGEELVNFESLALEYFDFYSQYEDSEFTNGDKILNEIVSCIRFRQIRYGYDYKITNGTDLRINLTRYLQILNTCRNEKFVKAKKFKLLVKNDKRFDCKSVPLKGLNRVIKIDISENEEILDLIKEMVNVNTKVFEEVE